MDLTQLVQEYGYLAVLVGTFLEGETILVLGGLAAQQGLLWLPGVMLAAFAGSLAGDQLYFFVGRYLGQRLFSRYPKWAKRVQKANRFIDRWRDLFILTFRFMYGIRTVAPFAIGASGYSVRRFVPLNVTGAGIWAIGVAFLGYGFGEAAMALLPKIANKQAYIWGAILVVGMLMYLIKSVRARNGKKAKEAAKAEASGTKVPTPRPSWPAAPGSRDRPTEDGDAPSDPSLSARMALPLVEPDHEGGEDS